MTTFLERKFRLKEHGTDIKTEVTGGITIFLAASFIVVINPLILSIAGMDQLAVFWATVLSAAIACIWMGLLTNLPFALAPAMGLNSYFVFFCVKTIGMSWENALFCVFLSGIIFMSLSFLGVQQKIVDAIPDCVKHGVGPGIGFFIAFTGLFQSGIIVSNPETLIAIGDLGQPSCLLALIGMLVTFILVVKKVKGALILGIILVTIIGIFVVNPASGARFTQLPEKLIAFHNPVKALSPTFAKLTFSGMFSGGIALVLSVVFAIFSFLFVDLFDSIGVLLGVASKAKLIDDEGRVPNAGKALFVSAGSAAVGAVLGTSTVTIYGAESSTGIAEGSRTGLTPVVTGILFLLTLFFSPVFLMIPPVALTAALVMVGIFMMEPLMEIKLNEFDSSIPAFFAVAFLPFTYNIAYGILFALLVYPIVKAAGGKSKELKPIVWILGGLSLLYLVMDIVF